MAESLIPKASRRGRILDIGYGHYTLFLKQTNFQEKYALDKHPEDAAFELKRIVYIRQDIEGDSRLPFPVDYFDVISMLAVIEHLQPPHGATSPDGYPPGLAERG